MTEALLPLGNSSIFLCHCLLWRTVFKLDIDFDFGFEQEN